MTPHAHRIGYVVAISVAALLLLVGASSAVGIARTTLQRFENDDSSRRLSRDYLFYNRRAGAHVFRARNITPGTIEQRMLVVGNDGRRHARRIAVNQDQVVNTGFGAALRLQLHDRTTNRCIYPLPRPASHRGPCRGWGDWDARTRLSGRRIAPAHGKLWRPGERHVIAVRYALLQRSTNLDQGHAASFRFVWRAHG